MLPGLSLERTADRELGVDDYQLQLDKQRIVAAYEKKGFFSVEAHSRLEHHGDAVRVIFAVTEGPRAVAHVEIAGLPPKGRLAGKICTVIDLASRLPRYVWFTD